MNESIEYRYTDILDSRYSILIQYLSIAFEIPDTDPAADRDRYIFFSNSISITNTGGQGFSDLGCWQIFKSRQRVSPYGRQPCPYRFVI